MKFFHNQSFNSNKMNNKIITFFSLIILIHYYKKNLYEYQIWYQLINKFFNSPLSLPQNKRYFHLLNYRGLKNLKYFLLPNHRTRLFL